MQKINLTLGEKDFGIAFIAVAIISAVAPMAVTILGLLGGAALIIYSMYLDKKKEKEGGKSGGFVAAASARAVA